MLKTITIAILCLATAPAFAHGGPAASGALIAHNAAHKVERLVTLNKIDSRFQDRFFSIQIQALTQAKHDDPAFKATVSQVPDSSGKAQQVEILFDDAGKALTFKAIAGPESSSAPVWPGVDALTLGENSVHYVLDNAAGKPELKPFLSGLTSLSLTQIQNASGRPQARIEMKSKETKSALEVVLNADGTVASSQIFHLSNDLQELLPDHQGGDDWTFLGCVQSYRQCYFLGHQNGFNYHQITHDHRYCSSAQARYTCWGTN